MDKNKHAVALGSKGGKKSVEVQKKKHGKKFGKVLEARFKKGEKK